MINSPKRAILGGLIGLASVLGVSGCYTPKNVQFTQEQNYKITADDGRVKVFADFYDDGKECEAVFYNNMTNRGDLPAFLAIRHKNGGPHHFIRENMVLTVNGVPWSRIYPSQFGKSYERSAVGEGVLGWVIIGVPGAIVGAAGASDWNSKMAADLSEKILPQEFLVPAGSTRTGFVYFRNPNAKSWNDNKMRAAMENAVLTIHYTDMSNNTPQKLEIKLQPD